MGLGIYDKARSLLEKALKLREAALGDDHLDTLRHPSDLANLGWFAGRLDIRSRLHESVLGDARPGSAPTTPTRSQPLRPRQSYAHRVGSTRRPR